MKYQVAQIGPELAPHFHEPLDELMTHQVFTDTLLYTAKDIILGVMENRLALFVFYENYFEEPFLFAAIKLDTYPQGRTATIIALAGRNIRAALRWSDRFDAWCRMQGCTHIYYNTHKKLAKIMERYGYRSRSVAVYKPLMTIN